ncbi:hypothetical protein HK104_000690 [Borealophlyctis nickersoniae]|nr:hypothetical protein HK104_000690 [Borealophlyctis nickersoniae]
MATTADNDTSMIPTSPISDTSIPTSPPPTAATQQQQHHQQPTQPTDSKPAKRPARTTTSKRAAQNRAAQRAFRERRGIYIKSLEQKAASYDTMALQLAEALARLETLQTVVDAMVVEREAWNKEREVWWREREEAVHVARGLAVECGVVRGENERLRGAVKNDAVSEGVQMDQDQDQETTGDHSKARGMVGSMLPGAPEAVAKLQQEMKLDVREWSVDSAPAEAKEGSSGLAESAE